MLYNRRINIGRDTVIFESGFLFSGDEKALEKRFEKFLLLKSSF